jgi:hypothetical protein
MSYKIKYSVESSKDAARNTRLGYKTAALANLFRRFLLVPYEYIYHKEFSMLGYNAL